MGPAGALPLRLAWYAGVNGPLRKAALRLLGGAGGAPVEGEPGPREGGRNVAEIVATVRGLYEALVAANETQEAAKRNAKASTDTFVALKRQAYVTASGYLDMAIAAVGKDTEAAKNLRRYRSRIARPGAGGAETMPVPTPSPQ